MRSALDKFIIRGISTNISFLSALIATKNTYPGISVPTRLPKSTRTDSTGPTCYSKILQLIIAVVGSMVRKYRDRAAQIDGQLPGHRRFVPADWVVVTE